MVDDFSIPARDAAYLATYSKCCWSSIRSRYPQFMNFIHTHSTFSLPDAWRDSGFFFCFFFYSGRCCCYRDNYTILSLYDHFRLDVYADILIFGMIAIFGSRLVCSAILFYSCFHKPKVVTVTTVRRDVFGEVD